MRGRFRVATTRDVWATAQVRFSLDPQKAYAHVTAGRSYRLENVMRITPNRVMSR